MNEKIKTVSWGSLLAAKDIHNKKGSPSQETRPFMAVIQGKGGLTEDLANRQLLPVVRPVSPPFQWQLHSQTSDANSSAKAAGQP